VTSFDGVLFFLNAEFTQLIHLYIYGLRKTLDDKKICLMFTKNNITVSETNGESSMLDLS
jgi:hypothetical protein